jgi:hypothetical protein
MLSHLPDHSPRSLTAVAAAVCRAPFPCDRPPAVDEAPTRIALDEGERRCRDVVEHGLGTRFLTSDVRPSHHPVLLTAA